MAQRHGHTIPRQITSCISNFYPVKCHRGSRQPLIYISYFRCHYFDEFNEKLAPKRETELKRKIFDALRGDRKLWRSVLAVLDISCLEFGGDSAGGLSRGPSGSDAAAALVDSDELKVGEHDLYEVEVEVEADDGATKSEWRPCIVLGFAGDAARDGPSQAASSSSAAAEPGAERGAGAGGEARVQLYAAGSFWVEERGRAAAELLVPRSRIRPRRWEVRRGEDLIVPPGVTLTIGPGGSLEVQGRGRGAGRGPRDYQEDAGRIILNEGSSIACDPGSELDFEGTLRIESFRATVKPGCAPKEFRMELEVANTVNLRSLEDGDWKAEPEEEAIVLQGLSWVLHSAFRANQLRTLGGRGWYPTQGEGAAVPFPRQNSYHRSRTARPEVSPRLYLYSGWEPTLVRVHRGPLLKVDLSTRMVQHESVLEKINFLRGRLRNDLERSGRPPPTLRDEEEFLMKHLAGRTCITVHNNMAYKIARVCFDKKVTDEFPSMKSNLVDYFQDRYRLRLDDANQPLLHCPRRRMPDIYLPSQVTYLTGIDLEWKTDIGFHQELLKQMRPDPRQHWEKQGKLVAALRDAEPLKDWSLQVESEPVRVRCGQAEHLPVYYSFEADADFRARREPEPRLAIGTSPLGFERPPWPAVWTDRNSPVEVKKWAIVFNPEDEDTVKDFKEKLMRLAQEVMRANDGRVTIREPQAVRVQGDTVVAWERTLADPRLDWEVGESDFVLVVIPDRLKKHEPSAYFNMKSSLTFAQAAGVPSQMVLSATLKQTRSQNQIYKNLLQQVIVKCGGFLWTFSPVPLSSRLTMVAGLEARTGAAPGTSFQVVCASLNRYFTSFHSSWRARHGVTRQGVDFSSPPGELLSEAIVRFFEVNKVFPQDLVVFRAGVGASQEAALVSSEVEDLTEGKLQAMVLAKLGVRIEEDEAEAEADAEVRERRRKALAWARDFRLGFILVRRNTQARFRTEDFQNVPSGTFITEDVVATNTPGDELDQVSSQGHFEFYIVPQKSIGTARPAHCSILYSNLALSKKEVVQLFFNLCGLYQIFPGRVALPAPLRYANKLLNLIVRCENVPDRPRQDISRCNSLLFMV